MGVSWEYTPEEDFVKMAPLRQNAIPCYNPL